MESEKKQEEKEKVNIIKILSNAITSRFKTDDSSMFLSYQIIQINFYTLFFCLHRLSNCFPSDYDKSEWKL